MKKLLLAAALLVAPGAALADCPEGSMEVYYGETIGAICYDIDSRIYWTNIVRICLVEEGPTLTYERDADTERERLVGVCRGTLETRP